MVEGKKKKKYTKKSYIITQKNESAFIRRMKIEEKRRDKKNQELMDSYADFYRQHILGKKD